MLRITFQLQVVKVIKSILFLMKCRENSNITYGSVDYLDKGFTGHIIRRGVTAADASINWALGLMNEGSQIIDNTTNNW